MNIKNMIKQIPTAGTNFQQWIGAKTAEGLTTEPQSRTKAFTSTYQGTVKRFARAGTYLPGLLDVVPGPQERVSSVQKALSQGLATTLGALGALIGPAQKDKFSNYGTTAGHKISAAAAQGANILIAGLKTIGAGIAGAIGCVAGVATGIYSVVTFTPPKKPISYTPLTDALKQWDTSATESDTKAA